MRERGWGTGLYDLHVESRENNDNGRPDQSSKTILIFKLNHLRIYWRYVFSFCCNFEFVLVLISKSCGKFE